MDAISIIQTVIPLVVALPFTVIAIVSLESLIRNEVHSVLAPVWCLIASFSWIAWGIINLYGTTTDYLSGYNWLLVGIGIFFLILCFVAVALDIKLAAKTDSTRKDAEEMQVE